MAPLVSSGVVLGVAPKSGRGVGVGCRQIGSFLYSTSQLREEREWWSITVVWKVPGIYHSSWQRLL